MTDTPVAPLLDPGVYKHYKGHEYDVIGVGKDTETEEWVVIYRPRYDSEVAYWVRPYSMFTDTIFHQRQQVPRFVKIS